MAYVQEGLDKFTKIEERRSRVKRFMDVVTCAFCHGIGLNYKFGTGRCAVCGATGRVKVTPPVVRCLRCSGSGRESGDLNCLACRGIGVVSVRREAATCPQCKGSGEEGIFYCNFCKGQGIV